VIPVDILPGVIPCTDVCWAIATGPEFFDSVLGKIVVRPQLPGWEYCYTAFVALIYADVRPKVHEWNRVYREEFSGIGGMGIGRLNDEECILALLGTN
jgi:hypothetical protein